MFSIIIPNHNSSDHLIKSIPALINQFNDDAEIIIIDDCSTNEEFDKLQIFANDSHITLLRNETNLGPGVSRNKGIKYAKNEYIFFIDADDYLEKDSYITLKNVINKEHPDVIVFDFNYDINSIKYCTSMFIQNFENGWVQPNEALVFVRGSTMGKCYKKSIITENNVQFLNQMRNEDMPFTKVALSYSNNIYYIKKPLYNYVIHSNSLMHNTQLVDEKNEEEACAYLRQHLENRFPVEFNAIYQYEYIYSTIFTKLEKKVDKQEILHFLKKNKINRNIYTAKYPIHIKMTLFFVEHKMINVLRLLFLIKKAIKK